MLKSLLYVTMLGLVASLSPTGARADDAYVCDGGRLVYARPETLEKLKELDPCIAKVFAPPGTVISAAPALAPSLDVAPVKPRFAAPLDDKPAKLKAVPTRDAAMKLKPRLAPVIEAVPPAAASATDYRNVRIISAPQDAPTVFRLGR